MAEARSFLHGKNWFQYFFDLDAGEAQELIENSPWNCEAWSKVLINEMMNTNLLFKVHDGNWRDCISEVVRLGKLELIERDTMEEVPSSKDVFYD